MGFAKEVDTTLARGMRMAERAVRLNENNEYSHWTLGLLKLRSGEHDKAIAEMERAIEINPNCSLAYGSLATVLNYAGYPERSVVNNEIAIRSNPRDPSIFFRYSGLGLSYLLTKQCEVAIEWAQKSILSKAEWYQGHAFLVAALVRLGRMPEAQSALSDYQKECSKASLKDLQELPFRLSEHKQLLIDALKKAGLRE